MLNVKPIWIQNFYSMSAKRFRHILSLISLIVTTETIAGPLMIDLTQPNEHHAWRATNDNVMGGVSQGLMTFNADSSVFEGVLSLENNGGFSSINRAIEKLPNDVDSVSMTFVGDGRKYQFRLTTWVDGNRVNYKHEFDTVAGERTTKHFHFDDFQAVFRGRLIVNAPDLKASEIKQVGLLIADKSPGPFALSVGRIVFQSSSN